MKLRTLIVDDEPLARDRLRGFLAKEPGVEVAGECGDGREAVEMIRRLRPDLVFLDVQMPELDGFGVLKALEGEPWPAVIFVTAHDEFALKAFEVHALDYLLKPFDRDRLRKALERAQRATGAQDGERWQEQISAMLSDLKPTPGADRLLVKSQGRMILVKLDEIDWIEAADNYVNLHVEGESHMLRQTMSALEERLPKDRFLRISRSAMVNLERVKEFQPMFHGDYVVILRNGQRLTMSRNYRERLGRLMGTPED